MKNEKLKKKEKMNDGIIDNNRNWPKYKTD